MAEHPKVPTAIGSGLFALVVLISAILLVLRRDGLPEAVIYLGILVSVFFGGALIAALLNLLNLLRNRRVVRERPDSIALTSVRYISLTKAMDELEVAEGRSIAGLPYFLCIVIDNSGLEIWGGLFAARRYCRFPWPSIENLEFATIDRDNFRGISARIITADGGRVELPLILLGAGPGGILSFSRSRIESLLQLIADIRSEAASRASEEGKGS